MLQISALLQTSYPSESDIEDIPDDCISESFEENNFESFSELFLKIEKAEVKNTGWENRRDVKLVKIIAFVYFQIMYFTPNRLEIKTFVTKNFITHVRNLLFDSYVIHHLHVTGEIIGYAHCFCNLKIRDNQNAISVIGHNMFSFDFFFVVKGIRLCAWQTKQLNIERSNLKIVQYAIIGTQIYWYHKILSTVSGLSRKKRRPNQKTLH